MDSELMVIIFELINHTTMKKLIVIALVALSFASCKMAAPKMYTTWDKGYGMVGSFYSMESLHVGTDTVIEGRRVTIIQIN